MRRRCIDQLVIEARIHRSRSKMADDAYVNTLRSAPLTYSARDVEIWIGGVKLDEIEDIGRLVEEGRVIRAKYRRHCTQMNAPIAIVTHGTKKERVL